MRFPRIFMMALFLLSPALRVVGMGKSPERLTVLMVPARHSLVQLGRDMAGRENVLLMSYAPESPPSDPFIHAWGGVRWLRVEASDYADGSFLLNPSARLLVVGPSNDLTASLIEQGIGWSPEVLHLESGNVTRLINAMGRLFSFSRRDWEWFAARYELALEDLNRDVRKQSWYDTYRASDLPPRTNPFRKEKAVDPAPRTSLTPIQPSEPASTREPPPAKAESPGPESAIEEFELDEE